MTRYIKRWLKKHPIETFLFTFNSGVFAWLFVATKLIFRHLGLNQLAFLEAIPDWILALGNHSLAPIKAFIGQTPWIWIIGSSLLTVVATFLRGLFKTLILIILLALGIYLVVNHLNLLQYVERF